MGKKTVAGFFGEYCPDLVPCLKKTGKFWPKVRDNTIPSAELRNIIAVDTQLHGLYGKNSDMYRAATFLILLRTLRELPTPNR